MQIYDLAKIPEELLSTVGGKAKGLYELNKYGFNVPKGFILIDANCEADFEQAYEYYKKTGLDKVAVRSSATIEDGVNFSNAGQYETILNVSGKEKFITAIKDCLSSLGNYRSQTYSKMFLNDLNNKMTIVVQEMVNAECAGVLFTKDPMNKKALLIECVKGLGESLVSGEATAEPYRIIDGKIEFPENPTLTEEEVKSLYEAGKKAEEVFKMPMDMEWAKDKKGNIRYLQARPITVNEEDDVTIDEFNYKNDITDQTITTCNVGEMLSTAVTPLSLSSSVYCLDHGMRTMMVKIHAVKKLEDLPEYCCITPFKNHMFFNQTTNYINAYRVAGMAKKTTDISICGRELTEYPDKFENYSSNFVRIYNLFAHFLPFITSNKTAVNGINKVVEDCKFDYDDTLEGLYKQTQDKFHFMEEAFFFHYASSFFSGAASSGIINKLDKAIDDPNVVQSLLSGVLTNVSGIESAKIVNMMKELASLIVEDNKDAKNLTKEQLANYLENCTGKVKESFDNFMKCNGHRGINESELRLDCWQDNLVSFAETLKSTILSVGKEEAVKTKDWTDYQDEILTYFKKSKAKSIKKMIEKARLGAWTREYTKSHSIYIVSMFRKAYRTIAKMLVEKSLLPDTDLIYFLTKEEIGELIGGNKTLVKKAMKRRRLYPQQCSFKYEEIYCGEPTPIVEEEGMIDKSDLQGIPASPGIVTGKVKIIKTVEDANNLKEGEIMVVSITDVGWTPYYALASGLITEIGSCLSHGVVVAREYGLPTIVNCREIMRAVKDGDEIIMDGGKGTVVIKK